MEGMLILTCIAPLVMFSNLQAVWRIANRIIRMIMLGTLVVPISTLAAPPSRDITYEETQKWTGRAFKKDEHIWIYNKAFAEKFRMPAAWINIELKGIEAAAFRVDDGERECGLGGKLENCGSWKECRLDIYVDEQKYPLPWLTDKTADWLPGPDSFSFLRDAERNAPGRYQPPLGIEGDAQHHLYPFGDWKAKRPAFYMQNAQTPRDESLNTARILAYQRRIHGNLTMIRLNYGCLSRNKRPFTGFWLVLEDEKFIGNMRKHPMKIYHHFQLPVAFERQIDGVLEQRSKADETRYRQWLNTK